MFEDTLKGSVNFLGVLCLLVFALNAGLLFWLIIRRGSMGLARCPRCGRTIACPHCSEDEKTEET